jgi:hypothetical protein
MEFEEQLRAFLLLATLALAGCTTPEPQIQVQHVIVPAPVKCVDPAQIPKEPPRVSSQFNGDAKHDLAILAPSAQALREWGQEMRTLLERCVGKAEQGSGAAP